MLARWLKNYAIQKKEEGRQQFCLELLEKE